MKPSVFCAASLQEVEAHLEDAFKDGLKPTLAVVFSAVAHDFKELGAIFARHDIDVFGASSSGEILNDEVHEESIVAMLLDIGREVYSLGMFDGKDKSSWQVGQNIGEWARTVYDDPAFMVVSGGLHADGEHIVNGIISAMGRQVPLFGGLAGDDLKVQETFVFSASQVTSNGVAALVFDGNVIGLQGVAFSGWKEIGTSKTITRADGNIVYEIDHEPALDVYKKYLNWDDDSTAAPTLGFEYPLAVSRDDGSSVLRGPMVINQDKSLVYAGSVPEGARVRFCVAPGIEIVDHVIEQMSEFKGQTQKSDAMVLFSCKGRQLALGPMIEDEVAGVRKLWDVPMVGFFTYGEIGPVLNGGCDFHNETLVPVLIYEK